MPARAALGGLIRWLPTLLLVGLLGYLVVIPLVILIIGSLTPSGLPLDPGWTFDNYVAVYGDAGFWRLVWTTLVFAAGSAGVALVLGLAMGWLVERTDLPLRGFARVMIVLPMAIPPFLLGIGWVLLLSPRIGFLNTTAQALFHWASAPLNIYSLPGMVFVQALSLVPSTFLILSPACRNMDPSLEEAGMTSGASLATVLRRIVIPLLSPAILAAASFLLMVGFLVFDIPGTIGLPVGIFVVSSRLVYLATDRSGGIAAYNLISAIAVFFLALLLVLAYFYQRATQQTARFVTVTGRGFRPRPSRLGAWRWPAFAGICGYFLLATLLPVAALTWTSLVPYQAAISATMLRRLTWANHVAFLTNGRALAAAGNSLIVGLVSASAVAILSIVISWAVVRARIPGRRLIDVLAYLPIAIPGTMIALALIYMYLSLDSLAIYGSIWIIAIAYITTYLSFGTRTTHGVMLQLHRDLEDAARVSGAGWFRLMRRVVLPLTMPAFWAIWIWVLAHCTRELSSALLLQAGDNQTLPVLLWNYWSGGQPTRAAAVGVWLIAAMALAVTLWQVAIRIGRFDGVRE